MMHALKSIGLIAAVLTLAGCATNSALYSSGPYENQVYAHFKNESPEEQILILEKHAQETQTNGKKLPPGYRAHLGLLYSKVGRESDFLIALEQEKVAFPESSVYIDKLLASTKSKRVAQNEKK